MFKILRLDSVKSKYLSISYVGYENYRLDISNVLDMWGIFWDAISFNQDIGNWNISNLNKMRQMFDGATSFNQDIGDWNTFNVEDMAEMFSGASAFNQNIGNWNTSNVNNMSSMFKDAIVFNQDISNWCVKNILTEPPDFSVNSPLISDNKPQWATCPGSSNIFLDK